MEIDEEVLILLESDELDFTVVTYVAIKHFCYHHLSQKEEERKTRKPLLLTFGYG